MALHVAGHGVGPAGLAGALRQHAGYARGVFAQQGVVDALAQRLQQLVLVLVALGVGAIVGGHAGTPVADLVPHQATTVTFGGLKGEIAYTDDAFGIDPDIQEMFYGDAAS